MKARANVQNPEKLEREAGDALEACEDLRYALGQKLLEVLERKDLIWSDLGDLLRVKIRLQEACEGFVDVKKKIEKTEIEG